MDIIKGKGTVSRLNNRGGGFIKTGEREQEIYFDRYTLQGMSSIDLREGQEVEFILRKQLDGYEQVEEMRPIMKPGVNLAAKPAEDASGNDGDNSGKDS